MENGIALKALQTANGIYGTVHPGDIFILDEDEHELADELIELGVAEKHTPSKSAAKK